MKLLEIIDVLEEFAPLYIESSFDNAGLIVGSADSDVHSALLCVDVTEEVIAEAKSRGCDLIISHHPVVFLPLKKINGKSYVERVVMDAIKSDIAIYASHTNLDSAVGGMSWRLADILGIHNCDTLSATGDNGVGFGVYGELESEREILDYLRFVKRELNIGAIKYSAPHKQMIRRVALCTGAGGSMIDDAIKAGVDLYLSAEFKHNHYLDVVNGLIIADIGHFESEFCAIDLLFDIIRKKIPTFALCKSETSRNPIHYLA